jgi:hypothetical protein
VTVTITQAGQVVYGADFGVYLDTSLQDVNPGLVLRDPATQQVYAQTRDATGRMESHLLGRLDGPSWRVAGVGDWSGDGVRDLLVFDPQTGRLKVWYLTGGTSPHVRATADLGFTVPAGWDVAAVYDLDHNGTTDLYLQSARSGQVVVWMMRGLDLIGREPLPLDGVPGKLVGVADLAGDGHADLLWEDDGVLWATRQGAKTRVERLPAGWVVAEVTGRPGKPAEVMLQDTSTGAVKVWALDGAARKAAERALDYGTHDGTLVVQRAQRGAVATPTDPEAGFVRELYIDVLGRAADEAEVDAWVAQLQGGATRQQVAEGFWASPEHRGREVDGFYQTYLHRAADNAGRDVWVQQLLAGVPEAEVIRGFLSSPEYTSQHASASAFVTGLYGDVLGRAPSADEVNLWQQAAESGLSRAALADGVLGSPEAVRNLIGGYYADYLGRRGDPGGEAAWAEALLTGGLSRSQVAAAFLASDEYFALMAGRTP